MPEVRFLLPTSHPTATHLPLMSVNCLFLVTSMLQMLTQLLPGDIELGERSPSNLTLRTMPSNEADLNAASTTSVPGLE